MYETADADSQGVTMVRMWSIGQWLQVTPDPVTEDIYDWYSYLHHPFIHL